jgi:hypothetical protein
MAPASASGGTSELVDDDGTCLGGHAWSSGTRGRAVAATEQADYKKRGPI